MKLSNTGHTKPSRDYVGRGVFVKASGIVRRIDDLGRIVIPKQIRRQLRMREGAPLEIFIGANGTLVLSKYSPVQQITHMAKDYVGSLFAATNRTAVIVDRDRAVAVAGPDEGELSRHSVGEHMEAQIEQRRPLVVVDGIADWPFPNYVLAPIVAGGDALGAVIVAGTDDAPVGDLELKLADTAANFLARFAEA